MTPAQVEALAVVDALDLHRRGWVREGPENQHQRRYRRGRTTLLVSAMGGDMTGQLDVCLDDAGTLVVICPVKPKEASTALRHALAWTVPRSRRR